jgi:outer membrane lipoprotein-sorting protein
MIEMYRNQEVTWKSLTSTSEDGSPTYSSSTIKVRFQYKRKMILDREGKQIISSSQVFTESAIKPGDTITFDGKAWPVLDVKNNYDLDGDLAFYEGFL